MRSFRADDKQKSSCAAASLALTKESEQQVEG